MEYNKEVDGSQLVDTLLDLCSAAMKVGPSLVISKDRLYFWQCHSW